jgi:segregation and condensation protein B
MDTLSVVAYRQPVLKATIESIRGVQCGEILRQLMERELVRIVGRSEELGRPFLYGTTRRFLMVFGLRHLDDLPRTGLLRPPEAGSPPVGPTESQEDEIRTETAARSGEVAFGTGDFIAENSTRPLQLTATNKSNQFANTKEESTVKTVADAMLASNDVVVLSEPEALEDDGNERSHVDVNNLWDEDWNAEDDDWDDADDDWDDDDDDEEDEDEEEEEEEEEEDWGDDEWEEVPDDDDDEEEEEEEEEEDDDDDEEEDDDYDDDDDDDEE